MMLVSAMLVPVTLVEIVSVSVLQWHHMPKHVVKPELASTGELQHCAVSLTFPYVNFCVD